MHAVSYSLSALMMKAVEASGEWQLVKIVQCMGSDLWMTTVSPGTSALCAELYLHFLTCIRLTFHGNICLDSNFASMVSFWFICTGIETIYPASSAWAGFEDHNGCSMSLCPFGSSLPSPCSSVCPYVGQ